MLACHTASLASAVKTMADLPPLIPEVENPNDINPRSSNASVNMYDFDYYLDDSSSDATSAVQNAGNQKLKCSEIIIDTD